MKKINLFLLSSLLLLSFCAGEVDPFDEQVVEEVASSAAIALVSRGRSGVTVMYNTTNTDNVIYKPYFPSRESKQEPIFSTTLLLSTWFKLERDEDIVADIEWSFDKSEYVSIVAPISDKIPQQTVNFNFDLFPKYNETIPLTMTANIKYKTASKEVVYSLLLANVDPSDV